MARDFRNKRVLITGASSGIGRATAEAFAAAGAKAALASRSAEPLQELAGKLPDAVAVPGDVSDPAFRRTLIDTVTQKWGGLDALVNIAGVGAWGHFASSTEEINRKVMEVNFFAPVELIRLAVPHLMNGVEPVIVNLSSMTGRRGMPAWPEYSASKAALVGLSEALRGEMARFGIEMVTIVPGLTRSDWNSKLIRSEGKAHIRYDKGMEPEYVARRIVKAAAAGTPEVVLGREARLLLLVNKLAPRLVNRLIARKVTKLYANE